MNVTVGQLPPGWRTGSLDEIFEPLVQRFGTTDPDALNHYVRRLFCRPRGGLRGWLFWGHACRAEALRWERRVVPIWSAIGQEART